MGRVIILPHADGQGDHLWYTGYPECAAREGHEVFLSSRARFRSEENRELIWKLNPFVSGESAEEPTITWDHTRQMATGRKSNSPMHRLEELAGFTPLHDYPQIYYKPRYRPEWRDRVVCDVTSISQGFPDADIHRFIAYLSEKGNIDHNKLWIVRSQYDGQSGKTTFQSTNDHIVESVFEKCDIIYSTLKVVCVDSGTNSLAAAIKGHSVWPEIYCLTTTMSFNDRLFMWPNVHYVPIGGLTPNFKEW